MKPIRWQAAARSELMEAIDWYNDRREGVGDRFGDDVESALRRIQRNSDAFGRFPGLRARKFVMKDFPYVIVYLESDECIRIIAIAHCSRRPGYWKRRLNDNE